MRAYHLWVRCRYGARGAHITFAVGSEKLFGIIQAAMAPTAPSSPTSIAKERRRPQSTKFTDLSESSISDCSLVPRPFFATQGKKVWERD